MLPQGKSEFPPLRVASFSVQNFPTSVRYGRQLSVSICRPVDGYSSMKFCSATSPVRRFSRPLSSAQPIVRAAALGSTLLGAVLLRGSIGGVVC